ncbi:glutamate--tRNA ligase, partial [Coemansia sp. RSA 2049]
MAATLVLAQKGSPVPFVAAALAEYANEAAPGSYAVEWREGGSVRAGSRAASAVLAIGAGAGDELVGEAAAAEEIVRRLGTAAVPDACARWERFARERLGSSSFKELEAALAELNQHLAMRSLVSGYAASAADAAAWGALRASAAFQRSLKTNRADALGSHVVRWYAHVDSLPFARRVAAGAAQAQQRRKASAAAAAAGGEKAADQGSFDLGLEGVEDGKVVTR